MKKEEFWREDEVKSKQPKRSNVHLDLDYYSQKVIQRSLEKKVQINPIGKIFS
jgi:hypothetical protein